MKTFGLDNPLKPAMETAAGNPARSEQDPAGFSKMLAQSINDLNRLQLSAEQAVEDFALEKTSGIHETMIALEKADVSFQLLIQVRNKLISAYETIMRIQV